MPYKRAEQELVIIFPTQKLYGPVAQPAKKIVESSIQV
jgi:hypothetical protein